MFSATHAGHIELREEHPIYYPIRESCREDGAGAPLHHIASERSSTIVFPLPTDLLTHLVPRPDGHLVPRPDGAK